MSLVNVTLATSGPNDGLYEVQTFTNGTWTTVQAFTYLIDAQSYVTTSGLGQNSDTGATSTITNQLGAITQVVTIPSDFEIFQPFQISSTGDILVITDQVQRAIQHLLSLAFTLPGERVMRPTYGIGIQGLIFQPANEAEYHTVARNLQAAYTNTDQAYVVVSVDAVTSTTPGTYAFAVSFTLDQSPVIHQAVFDAAGNLVGAT